LLSYRASTLIFAEAFFTALHYVLEAGISESTDLLYQVPDTTALLSGKVPAAARLSLQGQFQGGSYDILDVDESPSRMPATVKLH
jgi:hypothetical protein